MSDETLPAWFLDAHRHLDSRAPGDYDVARRHDDGPSLYVLPITQELERITGLPRSDDLFLCLGESSWSVMAEDEIRAAGHWLVSDLDPGPFQ